MFRPQVILHGGAGKALSLERERPRDQALSKILNQVKKYLQSHNALDSVQYGVELLEDCELFNAGTGSMIQGDGQIRMTAAIMEGQTLKMGAVINVQNVRHPIALARHLMDQEDCVLDAMGAQALKKQLGIPDHNPLTAYRLEQYHDRLQKKSGKQKYEGHGTVGAVALDEQGHLAAATSTGGKGMEFPGRVSDSFMTAATYASPLVAISCTGIGEHIIRHSPALRLAAWMELSPDQLESHLKRLETEARERGFAYGLIAVTSGGQTRCMHTTPRMTMVR